MSEFTTFLADVWRLFDNVQVPVLNISFAKFYLGIFVVCISIMILRPLLGIGGTGFGNNLVRGLRSSSKRGYDRSYNRSKASSSNHNLREASSSHFGSSSSGSYDAWNLPNSGRY